MNFYHSIKEDGGEAVSLVNQPRSLPLAVVRQFRSDSILSSVDNRLYTPEVKRSLVHFW